jgi:anti-anti-sigma factor
MNSLLQEITIMETVNIHLANKPYNSNRIELTVNSINKITVLNSESFKSKLIPLVTNSNAKVVLNLSTIEFIDSTGFDCLNLVSRVAQKYNSELVLTEVNPEIQELIELVKKYSEFDIKKVVYKTVHGKVA